MKRWCVLFVWIGLAPAVASAQAPAADEPSIRVGTTIFTDYTYTVEPEATDVDGNSYHPSSFNVTRAYINITGSLSRRISFRVTPDITRETAAGSSLNGNLVFRIKYVYGQVNLDEWAGAGSWVRLGIHQTPWLDYAEGIYRYRFQGTMFAEREGYFNSADAGMSFHSNLPSNYGDVHVGYYNGENYNKVETNGQKAFMVRGTVRPFPNSAALKGLRASGFADVDHYVPNAPRQRFIGALSFEHAVANVGFEFLGTSDQIRAAATSVDGQGYSVWATPKLGRGWEGLVRVDHIRPDSESSGTRTRTIAGMAYWFPMKGNVSAALMFDYDGQTFAGYTIAQPAQRRLAVHGLVNF